MSASAQRRASDPRFLAMGATELVGVPALGEEIVERLRALPKRDTENVRALRREFSRRLEKAPPHVVTELAQLLLDLPGFELRFFAFELLSNHDGALYKLSPWDLEQLGRGMESWAAVDTFAVYVAGPLWRVRRMPDSLIHGWARSPDRWWRRAALVSTVPLNSKARGGAGDTNRTLQVCRLLLRDRDPMVVKALSWALRELAKRDPRSVRAFLAESEKVLAARVVREVRNKLSTGLKNPRRNKQG